MKIWNCQCGYKNIGSDKCMKCDKPYRECGVDTSHDWNGCKCTICSETRDEQHSWNGCKCTVCGKVRNEQHIWNGCKCVICGKEKEHDWVFSHTKSNPYDDGSYFSDYDFYKCKICGKTYEIGR
jgi:hypothetical protein